MERVSTGIKGLDEMLKGGIPRRRHVALTGGPGTGKTSFGLNFLYYGAKHNEPGIYITIEETEEAIIENMIQTFPSFADIPDLIENDRLMIKKPDEISFEAVGEIIEKAIEELNIKRFVIDSITILKMTFSDLARYRQTLYEFFTLLRNLDCTGMIAVEVEKSGKNEVFYDIEHYVADGVINLYSLDQGEKRVRALEIMKMRATDHSRDLVPFKITPTGVEVYPHERVYVGKGTSWSW